MREVWKEFFRLKSNEIKLWIKYDFRQTILPAIFILLGVTHLITSLLFLGVIMLEQENINMFFGYYSISFLIWPCVGLIWITNKVMNWLIDDWELSKLRKNNVTRKELLKYYLKLKYTEISHWFTNEFIKPFATAIAILYFIWSFACMFLWIVFPRDMNQYLFFMAVSFLIWVCIFLIIMANKTMSWLSDNWKLARKNINYEERRNEK